MAASATPLFVADKATLKASLRLGGLIDTDAADDILNDAMLRARTLMIRVLGDGAVATLAALPSTDSPTTREEVQKVEAQQLEVVLTKRFLLPDLPSAFMDDSGSMLDTYQREAPFRLSNPQERAKLVMELEAQANDISRRLLSDMRAAQKVDELSSASKISGVGAVMLGPDKEAPLLTSRDGHLTNSSTHYGPVSSYTQHRLWHRLS